MNGADESRRDIPIGSAGESPCDIPIGGAGETPRDFLAGLFAGAASLDAAATLSAAAARAQRRAFVALSLGLQAATDAHELAALHAAIAQQSLRHGRPLAPTILLSAGPVTRGGAAAGGADFLLALALALDENRAIYAVACGPVPQHACLMDPATIARAAARGLAPAAHLRAGTALAFFAALGDTFCLEPAPPHVLRAILITQE
jgi:hydroxypyruvate reductase